MEEKEIKNWEEFESELEKLYSERETMIGNRKGSDNHGVSELLFRGQANSEWKIETTLDRYTEKEFSYEEYLRLICMAKPQIETFTDKIWDIPNVREYRDNTIENETKADPYMVYIRHHGFPSPFLDWTKSPYLAAFFAYRNVEKKVGNVSVYAYIEKSGLGKYLSNGKPFIMDIDYFGKTHKRHFLQQSQYTICQKIKKDVVYYAKHEDVFSKNKQDQDKLWKYNLPASERINFLKKLDSMNINAFSLFATEPGLFINKGRDTDNYLLYNKNYLVSCYNKVWRSRP